MATSSTTRAEPRRCQVARRLALAVALVPIAWFALRGWFVEGIVVPIRVQSGSMAETLLGRHWRLVCNDCGFAFDCGVEHPPRTGRAICPNCGYADNPLDRQPVRRGDRVLIDKRAFATGWPRRWEVVALRIPGGVGELAVKRVVGLPGEEVAIRHGDIYIDGRIQRKTLPEQRELAVLVHDNNFRPRSGAARPPRWRAETDTSRWRADGDRFLFVPDASSQDTVVGDRPDDRDGRAMDWLAYHHRNGLPPTVDQGGPSPVLDNDAYNQGQSRRLNEVADLMLVCRLKLEGRGTLALSARDGRERVVIHHDPRRNVLRVVHNGRPVPMSQPVEIPHDGWLRIEFSLSDRQVLLALSEQIVLARPDKPSSAAVRPTSRPLAIGAEGLSVEIRDLKVYRDVYYLGPEELDGQVSTSHRLGDNELFVLGDNSPISVDSRVWPEGGLNRKFLVGRILAGPDWPLFRVGRRSQVPMPAEVGYILGRPANRQ